MNKICYRILLLGLTAALVVGSAPGTAQALPGDPVLVGAGDIARCSGGHDEATAKLLDSISGTVFTAGDNVYPDGSSSQFINCYNPSWGRYKSLTHPAPGNHDYHTPGAAGYFTYFGSEASPTQSGCTSNCKGYYSYNLGKWHIIVLNSEIAHSKNSAQVSWLYADLAAHSNVCVLAYWHRPLYSSGPHGNADSVRPFWRALYDYRADVVINGHDHIYERFTKQNPLGTRRANGIRQFTVGTGGAGLYWIKNLQPNSVVRNTKTWGVLRIALHDTSYSWRFVPIAGQTFADSGNAACVR